MKSLQNTLAALIVLISTSTFAATISVTSAITANTNWTNNNLYVLYGDINLRVKDSVAIGQELRYAEKHRLTLKMLTEMQFKAD